MAWQKCQEEVLVKYSFKHGMKLRVDKPKSGFDSTNDGKVARSFQWSSQITGLSVASVKPSDVLLVSRYSKLNLTKFTCHQTLSQTTFVVLYPCYYKSDNSRQYTEKERDSEAAPEVSIATYKTIFFMLIITSDPLITLL